MTTVTNAYTRVTYIRHTYKTGKTYQMTLGLGNLSSLPDYEEQLDNLKEEMKTDALEYAVNLVAQEIKQNKFDLLINRPAQDMSANPVLQNLWKQQQDKLAQDQNKLMKDSIVDALDIKPYDVEKK